MKIKLLAALLLSGLLAYACASDDYNTQKGAAIGAIGGALVGQAIGHNTAGTLIGAAGGALVGAVAGNAVDQSNQERRMQAQNALPPPPAAPPPPPPPPPQTMGAPGPEEAPPGQWVDVPGEWVNGKWVPPHRAWVPVNPTGEPEASAPPPPEYAPPAPPEVYPVPGTYVYFVPGVNVDIFFYHGYWWRPFGGRWYRAGVYNGPWYYVPGRGVPRVLVTLPPGYRRVPPGWRPIPYVELHRNWDRWERERHWDHREGHWEEHH